MIIRGSISFLRKLFKNDMYFISTETGNVVFHPETAELLFSIDLHCLGCPSSGVETVSDAAEVHGLDPDELVLQLNDIVKK